MALGLEPLTVRDATANNLAQELDFKHVHPRAPEYAVPDVAAAPCPVRPAAATAPAPRRSSARAHWTELRELAQRHGWRVRG